ncbi:sigma-70 family RNA polymerase sigma factor [Spirillospora sp. NBC_00431]
MSADPDRAKETFALFYAEQRSLALVVLRIALCGTGIDIEDVASHMWTKIWRTWRERGPVVEAPKAYVRQCARRAVTDALRTATDLLADGDELDGVAARRWAEGGCDEPGLSSSAPSSHGCHIPDELLTDPRLIAAVEELTPVERLVILTWIETTPPPTSEQIAQTLGLPSASTVRGHKMRAKKKLRDIFTTPADGQGG